ncbi:MAG: FixH family protein [Gammaproteobacteria bacterium]|nr:FixH family protein [Gammaproteobacteria bacterium]
MSEQLHSLSRMTTRGSTRWYQEPFAWLVLGIPVVAVLTGMIMLSLSIRGFDGLVVDDYYKRGKEINRTLERDQAAVDQALSAQLSMEPGRLVLDLSSGRPGFQMPDALTLSLLNATRSGRDQRLTLQHAGGGRYLASWDPPGEGRWYLQVETNEWRLRASTHLQDQVPAPHHVGFEASIAD